MNARTWFYSQSFNGRVEAAGESPGLKPKRPLHPFCPICGWRKGGPDSWDGQRCKCGMSAPAMNTEEIK